MTLYHEEEQLVKLQLNHITPFSLFCKKDKYKIGHCIYTTNCIIIRYNDQQRVVNLPHVSAFLDHLQGGIPQIKIN
jgi:hypothetical protein